MEELVRKLTEAFGPSGEEESVSLLIKDMVFKYADRVFEDNMGSLFVIKEGPGPRIMVSAHMDEIGIIVTHIDENGFIRFAPLGGVSPRLLLGQRLVFNNGARGTVYHEKIKDWKELEWQKLYLDIGQKDDKSSNALVSIGEKACLDQPFRALEGGRYIAKAMDNRAGCAVLIDALRRLPKTIPQEVCFVFSVQEELGLRGARTAAYRYEPDYGLAVDVTMVGDTPKAETMEVSLGKGPAIKIMDRSLFCHPRVRRFIVEIADKNKIPYQFEVLQRGGTDAGAIHLSREGVPTGAISIPCRYVHTPSEMIDSSDLENAVILLCELLTSHWSSLKE